MDNRQVAQVLAEIADLLEIKGENAFKVRAYRTAAETIAPWPQAVARLDEQGLRAIPGIGKDLAARVKELATTGTSLYHQELVAQFPPTILDLLRLQGVGPKTVALLYSTLNIRSVDELAAAARDGRLRSLKGMGAKKEAQILKAIEERSKDEGRHLLTDTAATAADLVGYLQPLAPDVEFIPVGSLRRGCETCGDIDILAVGGDARLMEIFSTHPRVERVLGHGDTKASVRLTGGYQADLRLVPRESRGAAMQYFTGSKSHNIAVRDRAIQHGFKLNEYGLFRATDESRIAGETEDGIYEALGMSWVAPELRELRGEIEAAIAHTLPPLVTVADLRGDLHMHSTATDGRDEIAAMAAAAHQLGHRYIAITDHSKALAMANGLDERRALEHAAQVRALNGRFEGLTVLAGVECDILADGSMDLAHDCLAQLDIVVASVHSQFSQDQQQMTDRVSRALECPWVDVLGHPTGRRLLKREPIQLDMSAVVAAAAQHGVVLEINCQPDRLDLGDTHARLAVEHGVPLVISTDAHATGALQRLQWGVLMARRAWAQPTDILNTLPVDQMRARLRRNRSR
ncbi:MAG TPA: DNA polymerase/3'-5' exonuclease PolX [Vicinamibacterales bacterium]|nr:DNA polymerase/3'-5' exonuclease PolX [Vicinamibacterales bacterium]